MTAACPNPVTCPFTDDNEPHSINDHPTVTRPENPRPLEILDRVETHGGTHGPEWIYRKATPADLLAAVRVEVESGTIKGRATQARWSHGGYGGFCVGAEEQGIYLVIGPVSDGGEDRP